MLSKISNIRYWGIEMTERALFTWSGGKDSVMALYELQKVGSYEISALLTTVTKD